MSVIETERMILRKFTTDDLEEFYQIRSDPDVMKTLPAVKPRTREETLFIINRNNERWENQKFGIWAVEYKKDKKLIGYCGLQYLEDTPEVEIIYAIIEQFWGQGLITEAGQASFTYGFEKMNLDKLVGIALPDNIGSRRVMEKLGMIFEAETRNFGVGCVRYAITKEDFYRKSNI